MIGEPKMDAGTPKKPEKEDSAKISDVEMENLRSQAKEKEKRQEKYNARHKFQDLISKNGTSGAFLENWENISEEIYNSQEIIDFVKGDLQILTEHVRLTGKSIEREVGNFVVKVSCHDNYSAGMRFISVSIESKIDSSREHE